MAKHNLYVTPCISPAFTLACSFPGTFHCAQLGCLTPTFCWAIKTPQSAFSSSALHLPKSKSVLPRETEPILSVSPYTFSSFLLRFPLASPNSTHTSFSPSTNSKKTASDKSSPGHESSESRSLIHLERRTTWDRRRCSYSHQLLSLPLAL